jgi:hypothetical protein
VVALTGSATRPPGVYSRGPKAGTTVKYRLAQPIVDLAEQAKELGWRILGIIGDTSHLRKDGDHTPWPRGKKQGIVYAIDLDDPAGFEQWYVATARSDYDTTWIDFVNVNGSQYDNAGTRVAGSGDHHLHVSVAAGHEDTHVTLLTDYAAAKAGKPVPSTSKEDDMAKGDDLWALLHDGVRPGKNQTAGGGIPIAWIVREFTEIDQALGRIIKIVDKLSQDVEALRVRATPNPLPPAPPPQP